MSPLPRKCRGCGADIFFVKSPTGKWLPLDLKATVYRISEPADGEPVAVKAEEHYVSHYATCPKANEFSRKQNPQEVAK